MLNVKRSFLLAWFCAFCQTLGQAFDFTEGERHIQTLEDTIGAENFTYYRCQREGQLKLVLISLEGDVDIFASPESPNPTFNNYEIKSETCGLDVITIPNEMPRPVYIGLYGYPRHPQSRFSLTILSIPTPKVTTYEDLVAQYDKYYYESGYPESNSKSDRNRKSPPESDRSNNNVEDDMPLWWKIFLGILEFGIEVIL